MVPGLDTSFSWLHFRRYGESLVRQVLAGDLFCMGTHALLAVPIQGTLGADARLP